MIVTQNTSRDIIGGDLLVEDGRISELGRVRDSADIEIDAGGDVVLPGLINTHTHVAMAPLKGRVDDLSFSKFLEQVFELDSSRRAREVELGARLGLLEMIRSGTTTFVDLYYSEDVIARAVEDSGIRGVLCWAVLDEEHTTQEGDPVENCREFINDHRHMDRVYPGVGVQGVYVCSEETLNRAGELSKEYEALLHFHLSETRREVYDHKDETGKRPAEWLEEIGFLNSRCLSAHSAWLTVNEIKALARNGVDVSTCPTSNMKLATGGVAPIPEMLEFEVGVSIGTDSSTTNNCLDMFREMKTLALLQKSSRWDPTLLPAQSVLDMATIGGARAVGRGGELGSVEVGKLADLIIVDSKSPNLVPTRVDNVVSNIVYSATGHDVKTAICDGEVVMKDREVKRLDEQSIVEDVTALYGWDADQD